MNESVPNSVRDLIDLFSTALTGVKFPECDESALRALSSEVEEAAADLAAAEARCIEAKRLLAVAEESLLQRAGRAHAYARIYAEGDADLLERIEAIAIPRGGRRAVAATSVESTVMKRRAKAVKSEPLLGVIENAPTETPVSSVA